MPLGRSRYRCVDNIKTDLGEIEWVGMNCVDPTQGHTCMHTCTRVVRKRRFPMIFHNEKHVYCH
jgi:hypothetical protein